MDDLENPTLLRVHLKRSKCDQLGKGIDVFVGCVEDPHLCPVTACLSYMTWPIGVRPQDHFLGMRVGVH